MTTIESADLEMGEVLGRGGQALVVSAETSEGTTFAFKRYHDRAAKGSDNTRRKITSMLQHPPTDPTASYGHTSIAWPRHLVVEDGTFVGFLMDTLDEPHLTIPDVRDQAGRQAANVTFGWGELLTCARNLCSAVAALHEVGAAWGDLNEGNVAIYPDGLVTLLDIDTCAWRSDDGSFDSAGVGVEEFMPPERFAVGSEVTAEGDRWGLAVAVHLILMEGFHPFSFVPPDLDQSPSMEERILAGMTPLLNPELLPPPLAPLPEDLPPPIRTALTQTFGVGRSKPEKRTTALEWVTVLDEASRRLAKCEEGHDYGEHLASCPWCDLDARRQARRTGNQVRLDRSEQEDMETTTTSTETTTPARPERWWSLALVVCNIALVAAYALAQDMFVARSFLFPTIAIGFLGILHAESRRDGGPGPLHLLSLIATGALVFDVIPSDWLSGDRLAIAAVVPVLGHLVHLAIRALRAPAE